MTPRARRRLFSAAGTAAVLAALAAANLVSASLHARLDLSADRAGSLSSATKEALARLKEPVTAEVYFTGRLPPPFSANERFLRDLLDEYRAASAGRLRVRWSDPDSDAGAARRAREAGLEPVQVNTAARGRFEAKEAFMGLALFSGAKTSVLPVVDDPADLEYQLTRRLRRLEGERLKVVGFSAGHGEHGPDDPQMAAFFAQAAELFEARPARLDKPLPEGLDALWLAGPSAKLSASELDRVAAFAASGKTVAVLAGARAADFGRFRAAPVDAGLAPLLARWGVSLGDGLVADAQGERVQLQSSVGRFAAVQVIEYPFVPVATRLAAGHPALGGLRAVPFPFVSPVRFNAAKAGGARFEALAQSSARSWLFSGADLAPSRPLSELNGGEAGPFVFAGVATGPGGRLLIVGSPYQLDPRVLGQPPVEAFVLNLLEWSAADTSLLSLRGRNLPYRPLAPLPDRARSLLRWLLALGLPVAALGGVLGLHAERRRKLRALPALYADA